MLALRDELKSGRVKIARAKYVDKESVGISPEVYLYILTPRLYLGFFVEIVRLN